MRYYFKGLSYLLSFLFIFFNILLYLFLNKIDPIFQFRLILFGGLCNMQVSLHVDIITETVNINKNLEHVRVFTNT